MSAHHTDEDFCLPEAPRGLCFDRLDFVKSNFSVDTFLTEHGEAISLETIRDDLGAYLKVLRLAMIELINRDYANFVSLSATLVGFDKAVEKIQSPLIQLKDEVLNVKQSLEEAMRELSIWRNQESILRQKKLVLKHYRQTLASFKALEKVAEHLNSKDRAETSTHADRAVMQYNKLKFTISKCGSLIQNEQHNKFSDLGQKLDDTLNDLLFAYWKDGDEDGLVKTLLTIASFDRVSETETMLRKKAIAPCLHELIAESYLQKDPKGLEGVYEKILSLLDKDLKLLIQVTHHFKLSFLTKKYNFLINSFWVEVESRLEVHLASIFAPGNPTIFYNRYSVSMEFLRKLESHCLDEYTVQMFRETTEYKSFQKRWNLPVYFQIRFQEIAGALESALSCGPTDASGDWRLAQSAACWRAVHAGWADGVYVPALAHKLWKLSLQAIARYVTWLHSACRAKPKSIDTIDSSLIRNSIHAYIDIKRLHLNLAAFLRSVKTKVPVDNPEILEQSLRITSERVIALVPVMRTCVVNELASYCTTQLRRVSDIPRLYRKTNRSVPTKPCGYIDSVADALTVFQRDYERLVDPDFSAELARELFTRITESYFTSVEDVLTSVQKTEESLRRLKQIREGTPQADSAGASDGDKIRLQLSVDVAAYRALLDKMAVDRRQIDKMAELDRLVTDAVKDVVIK